MIGLIVALDREAASLIPYIKNKKEKALAGKKVIEGTLFDKEIVLIITGIGKVSAALSTQFIIDKYNPNVLINFGSVGAVNSNIKIGDYYIVDKCAQFDFDVREIDPVPLGYIQDYDKVFFENYCPNLTYNKTTLGTSDKFTSKKEVIDEVINMGCDIRDMEGASIAQVCTSNQVNLIILKGVTDVYGSGTDGEQFKENLNKISKGFPSELEKLFNTL